MMKISFGRLKVRMERRPQKDQESHGRNVYSPRTQSMNNVNACDYENFQDNPLPGGLHGIYATQKQCSRSTSSRSIAKLCKNASLDGRCKVTDPRQILHTQRSFLNAVKCKISKRFKQPTQTNVKSTGETNEQNLMTASYAQILHHPGSSRITSTCSMKNKTSAVNSVYPSELGAMSRETEGHNMLHSVCADTSVSLQWGSCSHSKMPGESFPDKPVSQKANDVLLPSVAGPSLEWSLAHELRNLVVYGWYWGPISKMEAEERLSGEPNGAFLVRDSSDDHYVLSLSFRSCGVTRHTRIQHANNLFSFYMCANDASDRYGSIRELIENAIERSRSSVLCYGKDGVASSRALPVRLTRPVSRLTQVRSLQCLCRFVIRQRVRLDLVQRLPLPDAVKTFIEEKLF